MTTKKVTYFQEFFTPLLFKELQELATSAIKDPFSGMSRTNTVWHEGIRRYFQPIKSRNRQSNWQIG